MSSNRRTAFARTPRGANNQVPISGPSARIDNRFLDSLTNARLEQDLSTVLKKAGAELEIIIRSNGRGNYRVVRYGHGEVLGDSTDVQRVNSGLLNFINDERKSILKESVSGKTRATFAGIVALSKEKRYEEFVPRPIRTFNKGFVDVFRCISAQLDMLSNNLELIASVPSVGAANDMVRNHLIETAKRTKTALAKYLVYKAGMGEDDAPQRLNDFLLTEEAMVWVFTRLTSQKMQLGGKDFEYRRVYFPRDPTKGLSLTFQELRSSTVTESQVGVLAGMKGTAGFNASEFIRGFTGIPRDWDLQKYGPDDPARVLKNVPWMVVPFAGAVTVEEVFAALGRTNDKGFSWNVGDTVSIPDIVKFLGTIQKRMFYVVLPRPSTKAGLISKVFPGFVYDRSRADKRPVYTQLLAWSKETGSDASWFAKVQGPTRNVAASNTVGEFATTILGVADTTLVALVATAKVVTNRGFDSGETRIDPDFWSEISTLRGAMTKQQVDDHLAGILDAALVASKKQKDVDWVRLARSPLSGSGKVLLVALKQKGYSALSVRVEVWLRSFLTGHLQGTVAEVIHANLDAFLANPVMFTAADSPLAFMD